MEIDGKNPLASLSTSVQRLEAQNSQPQPRQRAAGAEESGQRSDRIELSVRSREIQELDDLIRSTPDVREAKVQEIRSAIAGGTYNVRAEKIADKILNGNILDEVF